MFGQVIPTREGRYGKLYQFKKGIKKISNQNFYHQETTIKRKPFFLLIKAINPDSDLKELQDNSGFLYHLF